MMITMIFIPDEIFADLNNIYLPKNLDDLKKIECKLINGNRIYWYYKDDLEYAKECYDEFAEKEILEDPPFSGILMVIPGIENRGEYEYNELIVVIDDHPCEKSYPETGWIALNKLIDYDDLIKIFDKG